jgi:hypothetical protein
VSKANKKTKTSKTKSGHSKTTSVTAKTKAPPAREEVMDRTALKGIVEQLKGAGVEVKVLKGDTDDVLQKKVNEALQKLPSEDVVRKLESVDPDKLVSVIGRDCLGLFIDLSDVSCIRCTDATQCVAAFIKNVRGLPDLSKVTTAEDKPREVARNAIAPVTRYEHRRAVYVRDVPNPNPPGDDLHDTIGRVLKEQPEDLQQLRAIVEDEFNLDSDADFMKFVTALRDPKEGVIKLDVDLSEADKSALREAGYEI